MCIIHEINLNIKNFFKLLSSINSIIILYERHHMKL